GCGSAISGTTNGRTRELTYDLRPLVGDVQLRLRFAMDSHNGRNYDGFHLQRIGVTRFGALEKEFDFGKSAAGWVKDDAGIWHFAAPEGVTIGNWEIPHDYHNPYTV